MQSVVQTEEWYQALYHATKLAIGAYPAERERIRRGVDLVLAGKVTILENGEAEVKSQSRPEITYRVNGSCSCESHQHGTKNCVHRWARTLARKAATLAGGTLPEIWRITHTQERRDARAASGDLAAIVCTPEWRMRNGGQHEQTAGK